MSVIIFILKLILAVFLSFIAFGIILLKMPGGANSSESIRFAGLLGVIAGFGSAFFLLPVVVGILSEGSPTSTKKK